jgi:hypothetical protein
LEKLIEIELQFYSLVGLLKKKNEISLKEQAQQEVKLEQAQEQLHNMIEKHKQDRLLWYETLEETTENLKKKKGKHSELKSSNLVLEKAVLEAEVSSLAKRLEEAERVYDMKALKDELKKYKSNSEEKINILMSAVEQRWVLIIKKENCFFFF